MYLVVRLGKKYLIVATVLLSSSKSDGMKGDCNVGIHEEPQHT